MKYMLLLRFAPGTGPQEGTDEFDDEMTQWGNLNEEMRGAGVVEYASGLELDDAATTVRASGEIRNTTPGPAESGNEVLFAFYVLDVPDMDAVLDWAGRMPVAEYGSIEIRPLSDPDQPVSDL